jgi:large subunit ribosomal protein L25
MEEVLLTAVKREDTGKGVARKLRQNGSIPGVLYGPDVKSFAVLLDSRELTTLFRRLGTANRLINLTVGDEKRKRKVIIRELQRDPVNGHIRHIDLYQVSMKKKINMTTEVKLTGTPEGVKLGGILQHIIRDLDISCLPSDIPDQVEIDVSALEVGDSIHVSDISVEKVDILTNPARTIVTVVPPTVIKKTAEEEAAEAEAEAEAAEAAEGEEGEEGEAAPADEKKEESAEEKKK